MIGCVLNPGGCISDAVTSLISIIPYGTLGLAFAAGMIVGAALGKWGVAAVLALVVAVKLGGGDTHEHVDGNDAAPVVKPKKKVRTIFGSK